MSDALTTEAPEAPEAVTTPEGAEAAASGSVDSTEVIPKERFNGLMSRYNADKSAWEQERESMRAELERLEAQAGSETQVDEAALAQTVEAIVAQRLSQERTLEQARANAIRAFPGAAPLADLITGDSPEAIEAMARELHERLSGLAPSPAAEGTDAEDTTENSEGTENSTDTTAPTGAPSVGGAVTFDDGASVDDAMRSAIENKDFTAFMRAAERRANSQGADLTVG